MPALPLLSRELVRSPGFAKSAGVSVPDPALLDLPERAVQFGTGAFLRGFADYFIDAANRQGMFNGRIVAVGSMRSGREQLLAEQDGRGRCGVERVDRTRKACCGAEEVAMAGRVAHRAEAAHREARHRPVPPVTERPEVTLDVLLQDARVECLPLP